MHVEGCEERTVPLFLYIALPIVPILQCKGVQNIDYFGPQWLSPWPPSEKLLFFNIYFLPYGIPCTSNILHTVTSEPSVILMTYTATFKCCSC